MFLPDIYEQKLLIIDAGEKESIFYNKIKRAKHGRIPDEKTKFSKNKGFLFNGTEKVLNAFKSNMFLMKVMGNNAREKNHQPHQNINKKTSSRNRNQKLSPKQMLEALPTGLAQVKVGKTSENLLNKIRQIIYYLYHLKETTKNLYHIMN